MWMENWNSGFALLGLWILVDRLSDTHDGKGRLFLYALVGSFILYYTYLYISGGLSLPGGAPEAGIFWVAPLLPSFPSHCRNSDLLLSHRRPLRGTLEPGALRPCLIGLHYTTRHWSIYLSNSSEQLLCRDNFKSMPLVLPRLFIIYHLQPQLLIAPLMSSLQIWITSFITLHSNLFNHCVTRHFAWIQKSV